MSNEVKRPEVCEMPAIVELALRDMFNSVRETDSEGCVYTNTLNHVLSCKRVSEKLKDKDRLVYEIQAETPAEMNQEVDPSAMSPDDLRSDATRLVYVRGPETLHLWVFRFRRYGYGRCDLRVLYNIERN